MCKRQHSNMKGGVFHLIQFIEKLSRNSYKGLITMSRHFQNVLINFIKVFGANKHTASISPDTLRNRQSESAIYHVHHILAC
jgi:hypothetical protein